MDNPNSDTNAGAVPSLREGIDQFRRLVFLIRPYWGLVLRGIGLGVLVGLVGLVPPYLMKLLIDEVYPSRDATLMHVLVGGGLALGVGMAVVSALHAYFTLFMNTRLNNVTILLFLNHLQHLPMRFFEEHRVGEVLSRFSDVRQALHSIGAVFNTILLQGVFLLFVPPFLLLLEWRLGLVAVISIPLTTAAAVLSGRAVRKLWKRSAEAYADLSALQVETLTNVRTVKSLAVEPHIFRRASDLVAKAMQVELRAGGLGQLVTTGNAVLTTMNTALFTWIGWSLILSGAMSLGDFIAFAAYIGYLYGPINRLVGLFSEFQQSAVSFHRMFEYLDTPAEQDPASAYAPARAVAQRIRGRIELDQVTFRYAPDRTGLETIDLTIPVGTVMAVVGPSGSGKTTLLRLLTRLETQQAGRILIDGSPIEQISLSDLRRQIGVVWQDYSLLNGTVWDNLTIGLSEVTPEVVYRAARLAQIDDFVRSLPQGYQTPVAEFGASLSSGQRQRLAVARVLVRDTAVLLLDEATANIDLQAEAALFKSLLGATRGRTIIFVTHRLATASHADLICVLQSGRMVGIGTHSDLLRGCEPYRLLWSAGSIASSEGRESQPTVDLPRATPAAGGRK